MQRRQRNATIEGKTCKAIRTGEICYNCMKQYFYSDEKEQFGPFSFEELKDKNISAETLIWFSGLEKWTQAKHIKEIEEILELTPPPLDTNTLPLLPITISNSTKKDNETNEFVFPKEETNSSLLKKIKRERSKMNNALATTLAVISCFFFYFVWFLLWDMFAKLLLGWQNINEGGVLVTIAYWVGLVFFIRLIWKKIRCLAK